jgi:hypothetical protein
LGSVAFRPLAGRGRVQCDRGGIELAARPQHLRHPLTIGVEACPNALLRLARAGSSDKDFFVVADAAGVGRLPEVEPD